MVTDRDWTSIGPQIFFISIEENVFNRYERFPDHVIGFGMLFIHLVMCPVFTSYVNLSAVYFTIETCAITRKKYLFSFFEV